MVTLTPNARSHPWSYPQILSEAEKMVRNVLKIWGQEADPKTVRDVAEKVVATLPPALFK